MKRNMAASFVLLSMFAFITIGKTGPTTPPVRESPTAERLLQVDKDFAKASEAKGAAEAFALFLAEDAMQLPGGAHPLFGRKAIVENMGSGYLLKWEPKKAEVAKSGELGWTWGTYELHTKDADGKPTVRYGKYVNVWRKQKDGRWKVIVDLGNPSPPPNQP